MCLHDWGWLGKLNSHKLQKLNPGLNSSWWVKKRGSESWFTCGQSVYNLTLFACVLITSFRFYFLCSKSGVATHWEPLCPYAFQCVVSMWGENVYTLHHRLNKMHLSVRLRVMVVLTPEKIWKNMYSLRWNKNTLNRFLYKIVTFIAQHQWKGSNGFLKIRLHHSHRLTPEPEAVMIGQHCGRWK